MRRSTQEYYKRKTKPTLMFQTFTNKDFGNERKNLTSSLHFFFQFPRLPWHEISTPTAFSYFIISILKMDTKVHFQVFDFKNLPKKTKNKTRKRNLNITCCMINCLGEVEGEAMVYIGGISLKALLWNKLLM